MATRPFRRLIAFAPVALLAAAVPFEALAQPGDRGTLEQARELFLEATEQRDSGEPKAALAKFEAAHSMAANPVTAIELGRTQEMLGLLVEAREAFLSIGRLPVRSDESPRATQARQNAVRLIEELLPRIPRLSVKMANRSADSVALTLDGVVVPVGMLAASRPVNPGPHQVVATNAAGDRAEARIEMKEGQSREIQLTLAGSAPQARPSDAPAARVDRAEPESPPASAEPSSAGTAVGPVSLAGFGVGAAGFLTGAVIGVVALSKISGVQDACSDVSCAQTAVDELQSARTLAYASIVSFAIAGGGLAVGLVALLPGSGASRAASNKGTSGAFLVPWIGPGAAGVRGGF